MGTEGRSLEERVAALERLLAHPLQVAGPEFTEAQVAELREALEAVGAKPLVGLPQLPPLTQEQVRYLLAACVTVVKPGEVLVIRVPDFSPNQLREYGESVERWMAHNAPGVRCLVTIGEELGVVEAESADPKPGRVTCQGCGAEHQVDYGRLSRCDPGCGAELPLIRKIYRVEATRDGSFWSVHVPAVDRTTQALSPDDVEPMARDLIVLMDEIPADAVAVAVSWRSKP